MSQPKIHLWSPCALWAHKSSQVIRSRPTRTLFPEVRTKHSEVAFSFYASQFLNKLPELPGHRQRTLVSALAPPKSIPFHAFSGNVTVSIHNTTIKKMFHKWCLKSGNCQNRFSGISIPVHIHTMQEKYCNIYTCIKRVAIQTLR